MTTIGNLFQSCKITGRFNVGIAAVSRWCGKQGFLRHKCGFSQWKNLGKLAPFYVFSRACPCGWRHRYLSIWTKEKRMGAEHVQKHVLHRPRWCVWCRVSTRSMQYLRDIFAGLRHQAGTPCSWATSACVYIH